jgi:hypothetical protein
MFIIGTTTAGGTHPLEVIVMVLKTATSLAFATAALAAVAAMPASAQMAAGSYPGGTQTVTNGPQVDPGDISPNWSARQNVLESQRYDQLLQTNPGFREARTRKECGPITDAQLHQQCLDSFAQHEPYAGAATGYGSSTMPGNYSSYYGR